MKNVFKNAVPLKSTIALLVVAFGITSVLFANREHTISAEVTSVSSVKKVDVLPVVQDNLTSNSAIQIKELNTKGSAIIQLNTEFNNKTVDEVIDQIKDANRENKRVIYLLLDSPGGSVFDGSRLIAAMGNSKAPVYTIVTGLCASMCAMTLEYGEKRYMLDRTTLMFHPASMTIMISGEVDKIVSRLSYGKREIDKMDIHTAKRSGWTYDAFKLKTQQEYWLDSDDALEAHLIDGVVDIDFVKKIVPEDPSTNRLREQLNAVRME